MTKEFNNLEELKPYYDEKTNTYIFKENGIYIDVVIFNFILIINSNIDACDINAGPIIACNINASDIIAGDIEAHDINARSINAKNIDAEDIEFHGFCISYGNINCRSINGRRENHIMKALDGEIVIKGKSK